MTDPQPARLKQKPPRAEPLQPDAPTQGDARESSDGDHASDAESELLEQAETARKNTSEGYGGTTK